MRNFTSTILVVTSLAFAGPSYAEYTELNRTGFYGGHFEYGSGLNSCGSWVKWRKTQSGWHQNGQWVNGFISAAGYFGKELKKVDSDAMLVFMDNYCQQNPLNTIGDGAKALVRELESK